MMSKTEMEYKVSAVIPAYNREKTIRRCIDSVIAQTYPVFEIIVVDDGSTDQTLAVIKQEYGSAVRIIRQNHKGAQAARNAGIRAARGEYVAFLDSDDEWLPKKIELQVQELCKNADVVVSGNGYIQMDWKSRVPSVYCGERSIVKGARTGTRKLMQMNGKSGYVYKAVLKDSFCNYNSLLVSKKSLLDVGLLDENVPSYQEWDLTISLTKQNQMAYIREPLFVYHLHDGETISKNPKKDIDGSEYICEKYKYEIMSQLGSGGLTQRYKELMKKCIAYKDKRMIRYIIKYAMGKFNFFILK